MRTRVCIRLHKTHTHTHTHTYIYICVCVCVYTYIHTFIHTDIYIYIYICIYTHRNTYIQTDRQTDRQTACDLHSSYFQDGLTQVETEHAHDHRLYVRTLYKGAQLKFRIKHSQLYRPQHDRPPPSRPSPSSHCPLTPTRKRWAHLKSVIILDFSTF